MELEINGIKADLGNNTVSITRRTLDINNPTDRFIDITNSFILPETQTNHQIFNSAYKINSTNDSFDVIYTAKVIDQYIIFNGYGILTDYEKGRGYRFQITDRSRDVFVQLDQSITEMSWDSYDVIHSSAGKSSIATESDNHPLCWPTVCYHERKISANLGLEYTRPCLYLPGVLNIKLESLDYTFTNTKKLAVNLNSEDFFFTSYQKTVNAVVTAGNFITGLDTNDHEIDVTTATETIDIGTQKTRFRIRGGIEVTGTSVLTLVVSVFDSTAGETEFQYFNIDPDDTEIDFTTNDFETDNPTNVVKFQVTGSGSIEFIDCYLYSLIGEKDRTDLDINPFDGYLIKVLDNMPEMTFKDIYRLICIYTNSNHDIDILEKTFSFKSFSGLSKLRSLDWSDKFIQESDNINSDTDNLAKSNLLTYLNDETVQRHKGWDNFVTSNESLDEEKTYIEIPFGASDDITIGGSDMVFIKIYEDTQRIPDITLKTRIFEVDTGASLFYPLDWKNVKTVYSGIFNSLNRIRRVPCEMDLKKLDVLGWDLIKLIYIDYYGAYFIIENIDDFVSGTKTNVNLLLYA